MLLRTITPVTAAVDIWTSEKAYHISAYLPGVNPEDVEITFEGENLTIRGSFPGFESTTDEAVNEEGAEVASEDNVEESADSSDNVKYIRRELFHGSFERTLNFNVPVNSDEISATFKQGVLTLDVPKAEEILPKQIKIQVA